ncbi:hypothetical protein MA16_Dca006746 [Dendrobium catenatum]|uniref:Uncharacterized protein n=1 Tax=Dendrobium catenatum TaxID=906689 RepID=A0A2I0W919_9ASPA|nr:hypothetical protein MA16_Dca006746 [Dendrobium catenatum]
MRLWRHERTSFQPKEEEDSTRSMQDLLFTQLQLPRKCMEGGKGLVGSRSRKNCRRAERFLPLSSSFGLAGTDKHARGTERSPLLFALSGTEPHTESREALSVSLSCSGRDENTRREPRGSLRLPLLLWSGRKHTQRAERLSPSPSLALGRGVKHTGEPNELPSLPFVPLEEHAQPNKCRPSEPISPHTRGMRDLGQNLGHCRSLIQAASEVREQGAVDDRDTFLHGVRDLLSIYSNSPASLPTYVSAHGIIQQISAVRSDLRSLQLELENSLPEDRRRCINELCSLIQVLEQLLFASSTTAEPLLTPRPLMRELEEMDKVNSHLSVSVEEVTEAHRQKAEIVKHHPHEVGWERQVFVDFFCNPDRLRNRVKELTARAKVLQK